MGHFDDAVLALLNVFTGGNAIIKSHRRQRKAAKARVNSETEVEELRLRKSLRKGKADVTSAYSRDLAKYGARFADGDNKSRASLAEILSRITAGFETIIDRFTKGKCSRKDYQSLASLSNSSRIEAMKTFSKLSLRLSRSSGSKNTNRGKPKSNDKLKDCLHTRSSSQKKVHHKVSPRSKTNQDVSKVKRIKKVRESADGQESSKAETKPASTSTKSLTGIDNKLGSSERSGILRLVQISGNDGREQEQSSPPPDLQHKHTQRLHEPQHDPWYSEQRMSFLSFVSDSTKLGEIPEGKWSRSRPLSIGETADLSGTAYPLSPWQEPEKPKSRFRRLFGR